MYHKASIQNVHISSALSQGIMYKYHNTFLLTITATLLRNGINIFTLKGTTTNSKLSGYHAAMVAQCFHTNSQSSNAVLRWRAVYIHRLCL